MKIGQKIPYKTKGGGTHSIERVAENRYIISGFDECSTLESAKKSLEFIDSPRNGVNPFEFA